VLVGFVIANLVCFVWAVTGRPTCNTTPRRWSCSRVVTVSGSDHGCELFPAGRGADRSWRRAGAVILGLWHLLAGRSRMLYYLPFFLPSPETTRGEAQAIGSWGVSRLDFASWLVDVVRTHYAARLLPRPLLLRHRRGGPRRTRIRDRSLGGPPSSTRGAGWPRGVVHRICGSATWLGKSPAMPVAISGRGSERGSSRRRVFRDQGWAVDVVSARRFDRRWSGGHRPPVDLVSVHSPPSAPASPWVCALDHGRSLLCRTSRFLVAR